MTSILFLIETIYCNIFRCSYLKNKKKFSNFLCIFEIRIKFRKFSKKDDPDSWDIFELMDS